ncbi:hypothetical protein AK88_00655 [Plasmodium fragile]|uniref:PHD-type domain-containing protein n=1 Tax=Plasmodium fragile TaxID=5857 RepID=A0A0D9QRI3_PLAFR|nr:uncharacterized protein AK88_00655 [Plasmodium fragile]KJP89695.1 hypothetical protein AK88_00655 [Plasmodium fragile]
MSNQVLEPVDCLNFEEGQRNESNTLEKGGGGVTKGDESGKESQPYVNKSFNLVFCLFDNGNHIYLLIYESDSDNRKKYAKNKLLRKKNECNNIDYFFRELYEKVHQSSSKDGAFSILKALFCNGVGASMGDSSVGLSSGIIPQSGMSGIGSSDLAVSVGSMWSMSGTSNRSGSNSRASGHRAHPSPSVNTAVNGSVNGNSADVASATISGISSMGTVAGPIGGIGPNEQSCFKMSEMLLNKNVLKNILQNFSAFNITKNLNLKLTNVIELTYYDYLFIKRHKFFYSRRGVKIYDVCNNLYGEGEPAEEDLGGSAVGGSGIGGNVVGGKSVIGGRANRNAHQLTHKLKEIITKLYSGKGTNNTLYNFRGMVASESNHSAIGDVSRVSAYVKDEKAKLGGVVTPVGSLDVAGGSRGGITDYRHVNPFLWGSENSTFAGNLSGTTKIAYDFAKNGILLSKGFKEKCLNKLITKKNDRRDHKDAQRSRNKKDQKNCVGDCAKPCNTGNGKQVPSGKIAMNNECGEYSNLDVVPDQSKENVVNCIIKEFLLNRCEDNAMGDVVKEIIRRYNSFGGNTRSASRGKSHPADMVVHPANSFSAYDVYKLFLLDNDTRSRGITNQSSASVDSSIGSLMSSGEGASPPGAANEPQVAPLFKNKEEKKKYLNNALFDKAALTNFRSFVLKKRQMEFFYKNWNGLANCIERENNLVEVANILSFHLNRSDFAKQVKWRSVEEVETKVNLSTNGLSGVKVKAEENKAASSPALPRNCTKNGNHTNVGNSKHAIAEGANSTMCKSEAASGPLITSEEGHSQPGEGDKNNEKDDKDANGIVLTSGDNKCSFSGRNSIFPSVVKDQKCEEVAKCTKISSNSRNVGSKNQLVKEEKKINPDLSTHDKNDHKGDGQEEGQKEGHVEGQKESQIEGQNHRNGNRNRDREQQQENDGETFDELINHNYDKMKDLYNNLNEEIVKKKLLLMSKIMDENHFYNVADMPLYVNFVFYKYTCVNTWNNLVHSLRESFIREETYFFSTNEVMNKGVGAENGLDQVFSLTPMSTTLPTEAALPEEQKHACDGYGGEKDRNDDKGKAATVEETVTIQCSNNNPIGKENGPEEGTKMEDQRSETVPPSGVGQSTSSAPPIATDPKNSTPSCNQKKNAKNAKNSKNEEKEKANNFTCSVCFNNELNNINILYKCVGCSIYIHKYCYGIYQKGRSDEFLCEKCAFSKYFNKKRHQGEDPSKSNSHSKKKKKSSSSGGGGGVAALAGTDDAAAVAVAATSSGHVHDCNMKDPCDNNPSKSVLDILKGFESCCYICKKDGGALKKTTTNQFVHIFCVLFFISKVFCLNIYNLNLWDVSNLRSFENVCCICNKSGAVISCAYCKEGAQEEYMQSRENAYTTNHAKKEKKCNKWFHPLCAYLEGYHMNVEIYEDLFVMTYFYDNCFSCFHVITHCNDHIPPGSYQNREAVKLKRSKSYLSSSSHGCSVGNVGGNNYGSAFPKSSDKDAQNKEKNNCQSSKIATSAPCSHNQQNGSNSSPPLQNCVNAILVKEETNNEICPTYPIEEASML